MGHSLLEDRALFSHWIVLLTLYVDLPSLPTMLLPQSNWDLPGGSDSKVSAYNTGDPGSIPGSGRSPGEGNGNPLHYLAWKIPWKEDAGRLQSMGSQRVGHDWATSLAFPAHNASAPIKLSKCNRLFQCHDIPQCIASDHRTYIIADELGQWIHVPRTCWSLIWSCEDSVTFSVDGNILWGWSNSLHDVSNQWLMYSQDSWKSRMKNKNDNHKKSYSLDFPCSPVAKTLCSEGRGPGFDPWTGN